MPPKRKAIAEKAPNQETISKLRGAKVAKTSEKSTAPEAATKKEETTARTKAAKDAKESTESTTTKATGHKKGDPIRPGDKPPNTAQKKKDGAIIPGDRPSKSAAKKASATGAAESKKGTTSKKPAAKSSKTSAKANAPEAAEKSAKPKPTTIKYSNANTLSKKPTYVNLQWSNICDFIDDPDCQDMPKDGENIDAWCSRVSDLGLPVSEDGEKILMKMTDELEKRDQDSAGMYIYNDWNGWGESEVMENLLKDFDKDCFKKTVSPYKKWSYVEALGCMFQGGDMDDWMGNEDGNGIAEIVDMIGLMTLTALDILSEHDLLKPDSEIKNIPIICLMIIEYVEGVASDLDCTWACEIVRLCDEAGIKLDDAVRKQVSVTKKQIEDLRESYEDKMAHFKSGGKDISGDGYEFFAEKKDWTPKDDEDDYEWASEYDSQRKRWFRWDWATEYKEFKRNHAGGSHYVISKMSKAQKNRGKL